MNLRLLHKPKQTIVYPQSYFKSKPSLSVKADTPLRKSDQKKRAIRQVISSSASETAQSSERRAAAEPTNVMPITYGEMLYAYSYGGRVDGKGRAHFNLEVVRQQDVSRIPLETGNNNERYHVLAELPTYHASVRYETLDDTVMAALGSELDEGWFRLSIEQSDNPNSTLYDGASEETLLVGTAALERLAPDETRGLEARFASPEPASEEQIFRALAGIRSATETFVAVYDVGQGLCSAICDARTSAPLVYFDFGCGCYENAHTRPIGMRFCFTTNPLIILSHWHADHYIAASLLDGRALEQQWLAPHRKIGPTSTGVVARLYLKGNIMLWPSNLKSLQIPWGKVIKCSGSGMNRSGLVLDVTVGSKSNPDFRVLLPGDAGYDDIPGITGATFDGLVISHHGGRTSGSIPLSSNNKAPCAFSYGVKNSYKHPLCAYAYRLKTAGWSRRLKTKDGHIALGLPHGTPPLHIGCAGKFCDLAIKQCG